MTFSSGQTNFEHTFASKVTFYKPIDAEEIVAKTVTIRESSNLSTLSVSGQSIFKNLSVTGIATVNNLEITGELYDGDGNFGSAGQILSSDGNSLEWINTSAANVGSATSVGINENGDDAKQYVTFVQNKTANNPIRVDEGIKYNPSTNTLTVGTISATNFSGLPDSFPSGGIIIWSGAESNIPNGWELCDGQNGTPDLRNRFVVGASSGTGDTTYPGLSVNATGGSADAIVVSHAHGAGTYSAESDGSHQHDYTAFSSTARVDNDENHQRLDGSTTRTTDPAGSHTHSISGTSGSEGQSGTNANLPPYYALCYIMKT